MKIQQAYTHWAATYDRNRNFTRDLDQQVTRDALGKLRFRSILEIGCGTGKNTSLFAKIGAKVHALDFSEAMIEKARQKSSFDNVTFTVADINQRWPQEDGSADLVTCNLVLEHISDLSFIFAEAARVLVDGGKLFVSELHPFRQYQGVVARFEQRDERIEIPAFVHHISDFLNAAARQNLSLSELNEWWHDEDQGKLPRLVSFMLVR